MTTKVPTVTHNGDFTIKTYFYEALGNGDDGTPIRDPEYPDKTAHIFGTWGADGTLSMEVSGKNGAPSADGEYVTATDGAGNAFTKTANGADAISENLNWLRPHVTNGEEGVTDLDVYIVCRRPPVKLSA